MRPVSSSQPSALSGYRSKGPILAAEGLLFAQQKLGQQLHAPGTQCPDAGTRGVTDLLQLILALTPPLQRRGGGIGLGLRLLNGGDQLVISATQQLGYRVRRRLGGGFGLVA